MQGSGGSSLAMLHSEWLLPMYPRQVTAFRGLLLKEGPSEEGPCLSDFPDKTCRQKGA